MMPQWEAGYELEKLGPIPGLSASRPQEAVSHCRKSTVLWVCHPNAGTGQW